MTGSPNNAGQMSDCVRALRAGEPAVFPTDTVYGVGVAVRFADTPAALYAAKGRDAGKPVAWLVGGADALGEFGVDVPEEAHALAVRHWPGALTVVVRASAAVPLAFRSQAGTIGLRMPASEVALALVAEVGPIATSSANLSGEPAPRAFAELSPQLLACAGAWVEVDGDVVSGLASTVVDCSSGGLRVVRQGGIILR